MYLAIFGIGILIFFTLVLVADIITTIVTIVGFKKKFEAMEKVVTGTKAVSDMIGSQIYGAVDTIVTVSEPTRNHYEQYRKLIDQNRQQERELAAQHRAEEKAFAYQFTEVEKESIRLAKEQASNAMGSLVRSFKKNEQRLVRVVMVRSSDAGAAVMRFIQRKTEKGNDEIFDIRIPFLKLRMSGGGWWTSAAACRKDGQKNRPGSSMFSGR